MLKICVKIKLKNNLLNLSMVVDIIYNMKREMLRRKLSPRTVKSYIFHVNKFLLANKNKPIKKFSKKDVREYLYKLETRGLSSSSLNVAHNALRFMMIDILHKSFYLKIKYSKAPKRKPQYLTRDEIKNILGVIENPKHKLIVSLMYGAGLRVREVTRLKVEDLSFDEDIGWVRGGKGNKDRPFIIPQKIKKELMNYITDKDYWVFEGRKGPLNVKSVQNIVKNAGKKANIKKNIHPHIFRHSFTTHLLQSGSDISTVQTLLGHVSPTTTLGYSHAIKPRLISTKSPLDDM